MTDSTLLKKALDFIRKLNGKRGWHGRQYRSACGSFLASLKEKPAESAPPKEKP